MTRQSPRRVILLSAATVAALALAGCGGGDEPSSAAVPAPPVTPAPTTPAPTAPDPTPAATAAKTKSGTPRPPAGQQPAGPAIVYFRVATPPVCPGAENPAGRQVTVEWKVTGASTVTISIDGPGIFDTYPMAKGTATLPFPCSGSAGDKQQHTFMLATAGEMPRITKSITVSATVNQG
ncbi:hypothetical protein [Rhizomonospora bruguierae]|uniref:hypothetical protein n=1 Tax=Rhizomonospora bruguierae TaxID=1581705 RepID=UPI001BCCAC2C|nr:hypothetical protein [Micromonospora sp. NBRC 107566]